MTAPARSENPTRLAAHLRRRARWRWPEILFWLAIAVAIFAVPSRAALFNEILVAGLFALSLDLILGLTGVVSLVLDLLEYLAQMALVCKCHRE